MYGVQYPKCRENSQSKDTIGLHLRVLMMDEQLFFDYCPVWSRHFSSVHVTFMPEICLVIQLL
jgi:hypothetical protein